MGAIDKFTDVEGVPPEATPQNRWWGGTSRDLFGANEADDTQENFALTHVGKLDKAGNDALPGDRGDGRDAALREFPLDPESVRVADRIGSSLAERAPTRDWDDADLAQRVRFCDDVYRAVSAEITPNAGAPTPEFSMASGDLGYTRDGEVYYNSDQLHAESPRSAIETLAHEYRHVWQQDVIAGNVEHPLGVEGRMWLAGGAERYSNDSNDFEDYAWNPLEVDAEQFARQVYRAYIQEQED